MGRQITTSCPQSRHEKTWEKKEKLAAWLIFLTVQPPKLKNVLTPVLTFLVLSCWAVAVKAGDKKKQAAVDHANSSSELHAQVELKFTKSWDREDDWSWMLRLKQKERGSAHVDFPLTSPSGQTFTFSFLLFLTKVVPLFSSIFESRLFIVLL